MAAQTLRKVMIELLALAHERELIISLPHPKIAASLFYPSLARL